MPKEGMPSRSEEARANAAAQFTEAKQAPEAGVWTERNKRHEAETQKMLRLRALRLEKEAADKVAAATKPVTRGKRARMPAAKPEDDN